MRWGWAVALLSIAVAVYSQRDALVSDYVISADAFQHIWWMRSFQGPGLFEGDLLARYARNLQPFGLMGMYWLASFFVDPVWFSKVVPIFLLPLTGWFIFRLARHLSANDMTGLMTALSFVVTAVYLEHMAGGVSHSFGYPLLAAFFYFFLLKRPTGMALTLGMAVLFFPVVFAVGGLSWLLSLLLTRTKAREDRISLRALVLAVLFGAAVMGGKLAVSSDPLIGRPFDRRAVSSMPEMTSAGRWPVWPVEDIFSATVRNAEGGFFLLGALGRSELLSPAGKKVLLDWHIVFLTALALASGWWFSRCRKALSGFFFPVLSASLFWYGLSAATVLKLYAPGDYLSYTLPVLATLFITVPAGSVIFSSEGPWKRVIGGTALFMLILSSLPMVRNAGLRDLSGYRAFYGYIAGLSRDAFIAGHPLIADGVPTFAERRVLINSAMSVPLFDRYWATISARTRDFFRAYYSDDLNVVVDFMRRNGLSHLIVDREDFSPRRTGAGIYFQPFGPEVGAAIKGRRTFALARLPDEACGFREGGLCVIGRDSMERVLGKVTEGGSENEDPCLR